MRIAPCLAAVLTLGTASPVLAQAPSPAPSGGGWVSMLMSIILIMAVVGVSFMSSRRGHQD